MLHLWKQLSAESRETDETGEAFKLHRLTLHRLPSIEKIKSVTYGDVGNKQTKTNKQAIMTQNIKHLNQRNIILLIADCSAAFEDM